MSSFFKGMERISTANSNVSVKGYSFTESVFNFSSSYLAKIKL